MKNMIFQHNWTFYDTRNMHIQMKSLETGDLNRTEIGYKSLRFFFFFEYLKNEVYLLSTIKNQEENGYKNTWYNNKYWY